MPESAKEETVVLTSMPVQPVSKAEDHVCSNTPQRTTVGPPDSKPTMIQCLTFNHRRLSTISIHTNTSKILLQIQLHHLQFLLHLHSSLRQRTLHHLSLMFHLNTHQTNPAATAPFSSKPIRLFLDLFAGHSAPLSCAAKTLNMDHFSPFDIEFNATCDILNDDLFENLLKLAHSGLVGAVWSAPPCRFYSTLRKNDGGPPPLRSKEFLDGFPSLSNYQKCQVRDSKEIHRRSDLICIAVFQQGGFAGKEQPLNSIAWKEPSSRQFVEQCSCYFVATPACKMGT